MMQTLKVFVQNLGKKAIVLAKERRSHGSRRNLYGLE